jgi:hypothetical protein
MRKTLILLALFVSVLPCSVCFSGPPERWDIQIQASAPHNLDIWRGESLDFRPRFFSYGPPWSIATNATVTLYWSTNNFLTLPWATNGVVMAETGRVSVTWSPACDSGASTYQYFVGVSEPSGLLYRARGTIRMQTSPGFTPSTAPLPVWDGWTNAYVYATYAALLSSSNALALALQSEASRAQQAESAALATAQAAASVASAACTTGGTALAAAAAAQSTANGLLATGTAFRAFSADRIVQLDTNAWVSVESGSATLWRVESGTNLMIEALSPDVAPSLGLSEGTILQKTDALVYGTGQGNLANQGVTPYNNARGYMWNLGVIGTADKTTGHHHWIAADTTTPATVYVGDGDGFLAPSYTGVGTITLAWQIVTNAYSIALLSDIPSLAPYATAAQLTAVSNLLVIASTNAVDPVARASAASKPSYQSVTNIVSAYAAPSFPVYDYGTGSNVVFVLSNSVLYLYER